MKSEISQPTKQSMKPTTPVAHIQKQYYTVGAEIHCITLQKDIRFL